MPDLDDRRRFTGAQRAALLVAADGRCSSCHTPLDEFHADHQIPHSAGGRTTMTNGQALCPACNLRKGASPMTAPSRPPRPAVRPLPTDLKLRAWQGSALALLHTRPGGRTLINACPAAGKTIPALLHAHHLLARREIDRVMIVAPTVNLTGQWARTAHGLGINLDPRPGRPRESRDFHGQAITYAALPSAASLLAHACRERTLVIADEVHHLGEAKAWATGFQQAFGDAHSWLLLSGTPFRSDGLTIPGVTYDQDGRALADISYTYPDAVRDKVCRSMVFIPYDGPLRWESDGTIIQADFGTSLDRKEAARRHRTAIAPHLSDGLTRLITGAHEKLLEVREQHPRAGMLIVCEEIRHAEQAAVIAARICGEQPTLVTSEDPEASRQITQFAAGDSKCIVAVNMVSEGVDIPRLRVGVYATPKKTPMLFRQIVGRFIRTGDTPDNDCSFLLHPADPMLMQLAAEIEQEIPTLPAIIDPQQQEQADADGGGDPVLPGAFLPLSADVHPSGALISGSRAPNSQLAAAIDVIARHTHSSAEQVLLQVLPGGGARSPGLPDPGSRAGETVAEQRDRLQAERSKLVRRLTYLQHPQATAEQFRHTNTHINQAVAAGTVVAEQTVQQLLAGNELAARLIDQARPQQRQAS